MDIAADNARQRSDVSPGLRTLRQQWRLGMGLLEPFDNRGGLSQNRPADVQGRHQPLRIDRSISLAEMLAVTQVYRDLIVLKSFQVEGYAQAVAGATAEESVEFHKPTQTRPPSSLTG